MIEKGDYFTVLKWLSHFDRSYIGDTFEVKILDGPFVRALRLKDKQTITLNLQEVQIHLLSPEFVKDVKDNNGL